MERKATIVAIALIALAAAFAIVFFSGFTRSGGLPPGCAKPEHGFLVIASDRGFNDSVDHGAFAVWPVINVTKGSIADIVVCNTDRVTHSFQIDSYYASGLNAMNTGQVIHVTFVANETGSFRIFCQIFCPIHSYMQQGRLNVT